ncbi:MAG: TlpA disulfide reductase family protein [Dysgonomonas sp.]|nr:TlpA disulfide reductase family protein [Dysgonomonas sp.]
MKTSFWSKFIIISLAILAFISCKDSKPQFVVEGKINNADTLMLYLEKRGLTETTILDSVKLDKDGNFKFTEASIGYPEFFLLRLNGQTINLAIDSTETITVNSAKDSFATDYIVEGSPASTQIKDILFAQQKLSNSIADLTKKYDSKELAQEEYVVKIQEAINEYKTQAKNLIYSDYNSLASYFALFQKVDNFLIFDPFDKKDLSTFQAVATVWDQYKSNSPRAAHLKTFTLAALAEVRKMASQEEALKNIETKEVTDNTAFYNISLPDINNKEISLSSLQGKVVILDFTAYQTDFSPAHNILINNVYSKHKGAIEVYQVSFDSDTHAWQNSVVNLPWICVRDNKSLNSNLITKFNIQGFPTMFLLNKKGDIVKRILPNDDLEMEVQKLL